MPDLSGKWMMYFAIPYLFIFFSHCEVNPHAQGTEPPDHSPFTQLLSRYVDDQGWVDYAGWQKDRASLKAYLTLLANHLPNEDWSKEEQLAYWINLYNAFTLDLVLENYPVSSIRDIVGGIQVPFVRSPWDLKFIELGGKLYDLNNIEHDVLRKKWGEPRIHFAINCASVSCPVLRNEAYEPDKLDRQLEEQAIRFLNDGVRNVIGVNQAHLSKIFNWYQNDFTAGGDLSTFVNRYSKVKLTGETIIDYLDYDWSLNDQKQESNFK